MLVKTRLVYSLKNAFIVTGTYTLVPGVFLFVGYSERDETLLKGLDIMNFEIKDLVDVIQKFMQEHMMFNVSTLNRIVTVFS